MEHLWWLLLYLNDLLNVFYKQLYFRVESEDTLSYSVIIYLNCFLENKLSGICDLERLVYAVG